MRFLVYEGLAVPKRLKASFDRVRAAIERDDLRSADLKKLAERPLLRAKLDYDSRLLVQLVRHGGVRAALALEVIEGHAYDRARFLRGARVDEGKALALDAVAEPELDAATTTLRYLARERPEVHFLDKPISFDDRQAELAGLPPPLVLVGCAGSGKTALTLAKLRQLAGDVLYVTESPYLAESASSLYFAHGYENDAQSVEFLSFKKLLESVAVPAGRAVTAKDFARFYERNRATLKHTTSHALFEELRGVLAAPAAAPLDRDAYLALGVRQSLFPEAERPAVYDAFVKYRAWLGAEELFDPSLLAHELRPRATRRYDAVVVDEVQDLTNAELALVLATLKDPRAFVLCGDANQIVHPNFFSWAKVKSLFYSEEREALEAPIHVLDANYRSSRTVSGLANAILKIKNARFGSIDRESTALVRPVADAEGRVAGLNDKPQVVRELDRLTRGSTKVCVVVLGEEQKAEARKRYATPLVFSVLEAKGLEYETVILDRIVSSERAAYRDVADGVAASALDANDLVYARARDKSDKSLEAYKFFVNALYVAVTRAVETVYLVESDAAHPLLGLLRVTFSDDVSGFTAKASSLEEWQREARKLELQGKTEQAEAIRKNILRTTPVPWPVLHEAGYDALADKALAPNSIFAKAKQQLHDFGAFHELSPITRTVESRAGYRSPRTYEASVSAAQDKLLAPYSGKDDRRVLDEVARYGVDHRTMMSLTPLMLAGWVGNTALVEALLDRGARPDAVDVFGRMAFHFALRSAFRSPDFASERLGPLYDLLCPTGLDLECDGRLVRLSKNQGEFFALAAMLATFHGLYDRDGSRREGFGASALHPTVLEAFPHNVVPEARRRRTYWNGVLARAEEGSSYQPARRIFRRERNGHYVPSASTSVRVAADDGVERFRPLHDLLRVGYLDRMAGR